jgi:hypothetical protein
MELHAVFAYTIYGDKIRVSHYTNWDKAISSWDFLDDCRRNGGLFPIIKWFSVRSWTDPDWNTCRYRSMPTLLAANREEF